MSSVTNCVEHQILNYLYEDCQLTSHNIYYSSIKGQLR
jgi:hypothetical protein